jgi:hypothetical protein
MAWKRIGVGNELAVVRYGGTEDDLILDDGHAASWMNCCERPE